MDFLSPFFLSSTRLPPSPSSLPPPPPPPPMATLSDDFTADELDVAGILLRLPELIRVPFHLLRWGGHGRRSAGDQARRLPQPSAAGDEKPAGAGDGWYSPDTPLQFTASEGGDDDEGPPRKKPRKILKKTHKAMKKMFEELNRERQQMLMELSKLRESYRESHQLNLELKARMIQQDRLQSNSANPSLDLNEAKTAPLPSPSPAEPSPPETNHGCSDHQPPPESCCRRALERSPLCIPDLNFAAEEAAASGFDWSCGLAASRAASAAQARKRRMEINRGKLHRLR